jgi:hypothetical protein
LRTKKTLFQLKAFEQMLRTPTDGSSRPSLQKVKKALLVKSNIQKVKNIDMINVAVQGVFNVEAVVQSIQTNTSREDTAYKAAPFTCGAPPQDSCRLNDVYTRQLHCEEPIEKLLGSPSELHA